VLGVLLAVVAVGGFARRRLKAVLVLAVLLSLAIWVVGENFGALATGKATDPNSGLLLALLAATFWPVHGVRRRADASKTGPTAGLGRWGAGDAAQRISPGLLIEVPHPGR